MNERQSISSQQGSFSQFHLNPSRPVKRRKPPAQIQQQLKDSIPKTEDEWQSARRRRRFVTVEDINIWISNLILLDEALPDGIRRFINVAIFCVESGKDEVVAHRNYEARVSATCSVISIRNYACLVRGVIALIDQVYPQLRHRAFEAVLLYAPLNLASLAAYKQEPDQFKSHFQSIKILPEEHASQALYIPFLVAYKLSTYSYDEVCKALGTYTLPRTEFLRFVSVIENQKPVPHILPAPTKNRYDPIRDRWAKGDMDIYKHINTEAMFAIPDSMAGYKCFNLSETIQQKASEAAEEQDGCVPLDIPGPGSGIADRIGFHQLHRYTLKQDLSPS
ncbi:hypothetical protein FOVSG1_015107 [Fusarium oxysporum f. sp. vasinfectum]